MRRSALMRFAWLLLAGTVGTTLFAGLLSRSDEPRYRGKPLRYWLKQLPLATDSMQGLAMVNLDDNVRMEDDGRGPLRFTYRDPDTGKRVRGSYPRQQERPQVTLVAIRSMGTNAAPFMLKVLLRERTPPERALQKYGCKFFACRLLGDLEWPRFQATAGLLALAPLPAEAVTSLQQSCTNANCEISSAAKLLLRMNANPHDRNWQYFAEAFR